MTQTIMITGASKGLGKALALGFAEQGANLAICARGKDRLLEVKDQAEQLGAAVVAVEADISVRSDVERFVSIAEHTFDRVDVLINNASMFGPGPELLLDYPADEFSEVLRVNVENPFLMAQRVLPGMVTRQQGSIINLTSEAGHTGYAEWGAYGVSKFALEGLTEIWADEVYQHGVRINMVDPGEMDTEMHDIAIPDCDYPLAKPDEILDVFFYLASERSQRVNGQRLEAQSFEKAVE
ncbi:SDR family oxidoreductase [Thalassobacillus sp. CUG 92003]|uniref:SDR family oxidoreductase n=1 Tax=Thalassobacillus sp. CUG 92003 TaxID=2736641 RepID=UPI0015E6D297|nr:SDR family oxidoreductase [Thalassobacillus sp. CUG 92003]